MERKVGRVFINYIEGINPILLEMVPSISRYVRCFGCYFFELHNLSRHCEGNNEILSNCVKNGKGTTYRKVNSSLFINRYVVKVQVNEINREKSRRNIL